MPVLLDGLDEDESGAEENFAAGAGSLGLDESVDFSDLSVDEDEVDAADFVLSPARLSVR